MLIDLIERGIVRAAGIAAHIQPVAGCRRSIVGQQRRGHEANGDHRQTELQGTPDHEVPADHRYSCIITG